MLNLHFEDSGYPFSETEEAFNKSFKARRNTIECLCMAASTLDKIADVQKDLEVGGGITSVVGKTAYIIANHNFHSCECNSYKIIV